MVWVGPPLLASGPSPGLATPTWLPLVPLVRPPEPPVPIRLWRWPRARCRRCRWPYAGAAVVARVQRDDRVVQAGRAGGGVEPAADPADGTAL